MENFFGTNIDLSELTEKAISLVMTYTPKLLLAILTLVVGLWLVNRFVGLLDHRLGRKDPTLNKFLCGLISVVLKLMLFISVASMIGIETTSFIAVVGAAGLAIGLALQGQTHIGQSLFTIESQFKIQLCLRVISGKA